MALCRGDGALAVMGKNGRVEELQWRSGEVVVGLNRAMCGWRTAVRGELELAGGGVEGERRRGWVWARFSARGALLECCEAIGVDGWSNAGLWWPVRAS